MKKNLIKKVKFLNNLYQEDIKKERNSSKTSSAKDGAEGHIMMMKARKYKDIRCSHMPLPLFRTSGVIRYSLKRHS